MFLILGFAAPVLAVALLLVAARGVGRSGNSMRREARGEPLGSGMAGRWEGLAEELARIERSRPRRRSDATTRRRHLAAVIPADARR